MVYGGYSVENIDTTNRNNLDYRAQLLDALQAPFEGNTYNSTHGWTRFGHAVEPNSWKQSGS